LKDQEGDGRIILNDITGEIGCEDVNWTELAYNHVQQKTALRVLV
jgi:hypothetical protein